MFRLPVLALLGCAIAGASPLSWNLDIFQPANSLSSLSAYRITGDTINRVVTTWLPPAAMVTDEPAEADLLGEEEVVPNSVTQLDLSNLFGRPQIIGKHRVFGSVPVLGESY